MMPQNGEHARGKQRSTLSNVVQNELTDPKIGELLSELSNADLDPAQRAVVREIGREYREAVRVPEELVEELVEARSRAQQAWKRARRENDFSEFSDLLVEIRDLQIQRAEHLRPGDDPYRVFFEGIEPGIDFNTVETILDELRGALVPLVRDLRSADRELASFPEGNWETEAQMSANEQILEELGYDFSKGRLDKASHPFTDGNQFDCRIATRIDPSDPLKGVMATIHEYGHASYQLGLPTDHYGSPLGRSRNRIHESLAHFWENQIGRRETFWEYIVPFLNDHLGTAVTPRRVFESVNEVVPENPIRVDADELTYHLHVLVRAEVEKAFVRGTISVDEIPGVWNDKMEEYLGVRPETVREGCLQDIHWCGGFAQFQSYTIGSVLAAQLELAVSEELDRDVEVLVRNGEFEPILSQIRQRVHRHGQRYPDDKLMQRATGRSLSADHFIEYAENKYRSLYGV